MSDLLARLARRVEMGARMSRKSFAIHRKDSTEVALVAEAKAYGAKYLPISGIIDGILLFKDLPPLLIDWKSPKAKRTDRQMKLVLAGWPIHFVENSEQLRALLFRQAA